MEKQQLDSEIRMPRVRLGTQGLEVSKLGFGCMGLTGAYNSPVDEGTGISVILRAFERGVTFFDTSDAYGPLTNELLLGKMGELKKLVQEGKVKYIGLSEASADTIRRAHAVHPITALQIEWSLWTRDIEKVIIPLCRELGIGIVPYSPLGCGFFAGKAVAECLPRTSLHPRFSGENIEKNKILYRRIKDLAEKHQCTPSQLALAWVLYQGNDVVPIPGTTKIKNLDDNIDSLKVRLTDEDLLEISAAVPLEDVAGGRTYVHLTAATWDIADTPPLPKCSSD